MQHLSCLKNLFQVIVFVTLTCGCCALVQECGQRKVNHVNLIHGGQRASPGKWPWHATITHRLRNEFVVVCGGSIIDEYTILTAAHCLYTQHGRISLNRLEVHVGRSEMLIRNPHTRAYTPNVFFIHPGYNQSDVKNDIALIRLGNEIELNDYVQPVCVCSAENDTSIVGRIGTVVGFGLNDINTVSDYLMEAEVPIVDRWTCVESNRDVFGMQLTRNMLCAGERNRVGPCNGDSGGGLVFLNDIVWCVRGIVSFTPNLYGTSVCDPEQYVVYTDVAKYIDWLRNNSNAIYYSNVQKFSTTTEYHEDKSYVSSIVSESSQAACGLPKDSGSCLHNVFKYFFDTELGFCRRFLYGGCEGNMNRFDTELECKITCITPVGKRICFLPKSAGRCTRMLRRWYFNSYLKTCEQFIYGGCNGNANRFESLEDCVENCSEQISKENLQI